MKGGRSGLERSSAHRFAGRGSAAPRGRARRTGGGAPRTHRAPPCCRVAVRGVAGKGAGP